MYRCKLCTLKLNEVKEHRTGIHQHCAEATAHLTNADLAALEPLLHPPPEVW